MERPYDPCRGPSWPIWTRRCVRRPRYALRFTTRTRGPSPAMRAALAAMQDHRRRWDAARRDTLRELGSNAHPVSDVRIGLPPDVSPRRRFGGSL